MAHETEDPTSLLLRSRAGDERAADHLVPVVYEELRRIAAALLASASPDATLQPTSLVHEAYLRLVDQSRVAWQDRVHFAAVAATMLRRVLVDAARRHGRQKRGGGWKKESLTRVEAHAAEAKDYEELDAALERLKAEDERAARVVELRFFGGLTIPETAEVLEVSTPTVERDWRFARAWLREALAADEGTP